MAGSGILPDELDLVPANPLDVDTGEMQQLFLDQISGIYQLLGAQAAQALTIASGSVTPNRAIVVLDTEGAASSDDLTNVAVTNLEEGRFLLLRSTADARNVVVKNASGGSGQLLTADGADFTLDTTKMWIGFYRSGTDWVEVLRSYGLAASATAGANQFVLSDGSGKIDSDYIDRPDAATGEVYLGTVAVSAQASLPITSLITAAYPEYRLSLDYVLPATDATVLRMHVSTDNGSSWKTSSNYDYAGRGIDSGGSAPYSFASQNEIVLAGTIFSTVGNATNFERVSGSIRIKNGDASNPVRIHSDLSYREAAGTDFVDQVTKAQYRTLEAINAVRLIMSSGNISGSVRVYGVRNA